jgi:hypothetical protein
MCARARVFICVCGDFVWTSHILTTQEPSNLNYSRHVFALLDVCFINIMQQRPPDKHVSYYRVENVRSKLRKFKSRNVEFFLCRVDWMSSTPSHSKSTFCVVLNVSCVPCRFTKWHVVQWHILEIACRTAWGSPRFEVTRMVLRDASSFTASCEY